MELIANVLTCGLLLGVMYMHTHAAITQDYVLDVLPNCGSDGIQDAYIVVRSDIATHVDAECSNGVFDVPSIDDVHFRIQVSYNSPPTRMCTFNKRRDDKVYVIKLVAWYGDPDHSLRQDTLEYTVTCTFSPKANSYSTEQHVIQGLIAPVELQTHNGPITDVSVSIQMIDVSGKTLVDEEVQLGRAVQLTLEASDTNGAVGIKPVACDAIGLESGNHYAILRAGCGDGLVFQQDAGFTTEGLISTSPYFEAFGIGRDVRLRFECNVTICSTTCNGGTCISEKRKRSEDAREDTTPVVGVTLDWTLLNPHHTTDADPNDTEPVMGNPISVPSEYTDMLDETVDGALPEPHAEIIKLRDKMQPDIKPGISDQDTDQFDDSLSIEELHQRLVELAKVLSPEDVDRLDEVFRSGHLARNRRRARGTGFLQDGHQSQRAGASSVDPNEGEGVHTDSPSGSAHVPAASGDVWRPHGQETDPDVEPKPKRAHGYKTRSQLRDTLLPHIPGEVQPPSVEEDSRETDSIIPVSEQPELGINMHRFSEQEMIAHKHDVFMDNGVHVITAEMFHDKPVQIGHIKLENNSTVNEADMDSSMLSEMHGVRKGNHTDRYVRGIAGDESEDLGVDDEHAGTHHSAIHTADGDRADTRLLELALNLIAGLPSEATEEHTGGVLINEELHTFNKTVAHADDLLADRHRAGIGMQGMVEEDQNQVAETLDSVHRRRLTEARDGDAISEDAVHADSSEYGDGDHYPDWLLDIVHDVELDDVRNDDGALPDRRLVGTANNGMSADNVAGTMRHAVLSATQDASSGHNDEWLETIHADVPAETEDNSDIFTLLSKVYPLTGVSQSNSAGRNTSDVVSDDVNMVNLPILNAIFSHEKHLNSTGGHANWSLLDSGPGSRAKSGFRELETGNYVIDIVTTSSDGPLSNVLLRHAPTAGHNGQGVVDNSPAIIISLGVLVVLTIGILAFWVVMFMRPFSRDSYDVERC